MREYDPTEFTILVGRDRCDEAIMQVVCKACPVRSNDIVFVVGYRDVASVAALDTACRTHWGTDHGEGS